LITKIKYIQEQYKGTNNINYKNIYYFSYSNNTINPCILEDSFEVSDIKWLSISECLEKIRLYDKTKLQMIKSIYFFIVNHIINNCNSLYI
jgi:hypothetical protein